MHRSAAIRTQHCSKNNYREYIRRMCAYARARVCVICVAKMHLSAMKVRGGMHEGV